jgi:hypothetical protein
MGILLQIVAQSTDCGVIYKDTCVHRSFITMQPYSFYGQIDLFGIDKTYYQATPCFKCGTVERSAG